MASVRVMLYILFYWFIITDALLHIHHVNVVAGQANFNYTTHIYIYWVVRTIY